MQRHLQSEMVRATPKFCLRNPHSKYEVLVSSHVSYASYSFSLPSQKVCLSSDHSGSRNSEQLPLGGLQTSVW